MPSTNINLLDINDREVAVSEAGEIYARGRR